MKLYSSIFVLTIVTFCDGALLKGILQGAHDVAGAFLGNFNIGGHVGFNSQTQGGRYPPHNGQQRPDKETIVVVIEDSDKPPQGQPGYGGNGNYNRPHHHQHPGHKYSPNQYPNGNTYGNQNQNNFNNQGYPNNPNWKPNNQYGTDSNQYGNQNPNPTNQYDSTNNHYGNPTNQNKIPNKQQSDGNPNTQYNNPSGHYGNTNYQYGNSNDHQGNQNNQQNNPNNQHENKFPNNQPAGGDKPNYQDQVTHNVNSKPAQNSNDNELKPAQNSNDSGNKQIKDSDNKVDVTTKDPTGGDDHPLFIPLNDYIYGGSNGQANAPKRETDNNKNKPAEDEEIFPIDIRMPQSETS